MTEQDRRYAIGDAVRRNSDSRRWKVAETGVYERDDPKGNYKAGDQWVKLTEDPSKPLTWYGGRRRPSNDFYPDDGSEIPRRQDKNRHLSVRFPKEGLTKDEFRWLAELCGETPNELAVRLLTEGYEAEMERRNAG